MAGPPNRRRNTPKRTQHPRRPQPADLWRTPPPLPDGDPIPVPYDVTALLRSLGDAPTIGRSTDLGPTLEAVIQRTAVIAMALATSADLVREPGDE